MSHDEFLLTQLDALAEQLGIIVRHENVLMEESSGAGGLCRLDGKDVIFIHAKTTAKEKVAIMVKALREYDLSDIYVRPAVRELLDQSEEQ
ncbi:MAG: hypothetical protein PHU03_06425 [Syntrophales bacterium]|nr:hypothetical protein [Syntrophales bacterium]